MFDFLTVKNRESALQALRDVWMRGGVDISPPVIRLLTRWDRAGGHDINDADYGRNVWDRVIIAGIWPIELLASGLGSLLIVAIRAAKPPRDLSRNQGRYSQRSVQRVKQRTRARVDDYARAHFVHRVAETDFGLRISKAKRTAGARMTKRVRVRTPLIIRLRKHEAAAETRRDQQHLVGPIGFFAIAIRDLFWRHHPNAINPAATRKRAIEPCQRTCRCMAIGGRYFRGAPSGRVDQPHSSAR